MLSALEKFRKHVGEANNEEGCDYGLEIADLKRQVEEKNLIRLKILKENEELERIGDEEIVADLIKKVSEELRMEIRRNEMMEELLAKGLAGCGSDREGGGALTERRRPEAKALTSAKPLKMPSKSPCRPPTSCTNKKKPEISNSLAMVIQQAPKTLENTKTEKRIISPNLSSNSLRYSTPPNQRILNLSTISNN